MRSASAASSGASITGPEQPREPHSGGQLRRAQDAEVTEELDIIEDTEEEDDSMIHFGDIIVYKVEFTGKSEDLILKLASQLVKDNVFSQENVQSFGEIITAKETALTDTDISMEVLDGHWRTILETTAAETGQGTDPMLTSIEIQPKLMDPNIFIGLAMLAALVISVFALEHRKRK